MRSYKDWYDKHEKTKCDMCGGLFHDKTSCPFLRTICKLGKKHTGKRNQSYLPWTVSSRENPLEEEKKSEANNVSQFVNHKKQGFSLKISVEDLKKHSMNPADDDEEIY